MSKSNTPATDLYQQSLVELLERYAQKHGRTAAGDGCWIPMSDSSISRKFFGWQDFASRLRQGKITLQKAREFEELALAGLKGTPQPKP